jgi:hypothetical protein
MAVPALRRRERCGGSSFDFFLFIASVDARLQRTLIIFPISLPYGIDIDMRLRPSRRPDHRWSRSAGKRLSLPI